MQAPDGSGGPAEWRLRPDTPLTPVLSRYWDDPESWTLETYRRHDGYQALQKALTMEPDAVIGAVKDSGLRGRGGAGFLDRDEVVVHPAGRQRRGRQAALPGGQRRRVGTRYVQRHSADAGHAARPRRRRDHRRRTRSGPATRSSTSAVKCCRCCGGCRTRWPRPTPPAILGRDIAGSGFDLELVVHAGAGAYICGEETALLDSLEGRRGQPRLRPPFPAVAGLYGCPTVINNVETIASVPPIILNGVDWFRSMGSEKSPGFTLYSLSGHVTRPGQYEAPLGITLRELLDYAGGVRAGHKLKFWTPGGSSTPLLTDEHLDVPLDYEGVAAAGSMLGTKALEIFDETTCVVRAVRRWTEFYKHESCGKCTPCREGTFWLGQIYQRLETGHGTRGHRQTGGHRRRDFRKVVLRVGRWCGQPGRVVDQVLPRRVRRAHRGRRLPVRSASFHAGEPERGGRVTQVPTAERRGGPRHARRVGYLPRLIAGAGDADHRRHRSQLFPRALW